MGLEKGDEAYPRAKAIMKVTAGMRLLIALAMDDDAR